MWQAMTQGNKIEYRFGQVDGKIQVKTDVVKSGKNIGKANETTPAQQALFNMETKALKKIENGYKLVEGTISAHLTKLEKDHSIPAPMLAHEYSKQGHKLKEHIYVQPKFDGIRGLFDLKTGYGYSRNGKRILGVPHIEEQVKQLKLPGIQFIDGELYTPDLTFEDIISVVKKTKTLSDQSLRKKISLYVFDVIADGLFNERLEHLEALKDQQKNIKVSKTVLTENTKSNIEALHSKFVEQRYEGIMLRNDAKYEHKRSYNLQKYKHFFDKEYKVVGFDKQEDEDTLGSLICVDKQGREFKARPKMTREARLEIWQNQKKYLGKMVTVKYQEMTMNGNGVPRFPIAIAWRDYE